MIMAAIISDLYSGFDRNYKSALELRELLNQDIEAAILDRLTIIALTQSASF
jgi:hypothetical protein